jgi:integrase
MTETRFRFTKSSLEGAEAPAKGSRFYWDDKTPGLALRVTAGGARTFYVYRKVNGKPEQLRIGPFPSLTVEQARAKANEIVGALALGRDIAEERRAVRKDPTFAEVFAWYLDAHAKPRKRSWKKDADQFRLYLGELGKVKCAKVTRGHVRAVHREVATKAGPYAANRTLALIRTVFNKATAHDVLTIANPATGIEMMPEVSRDRRLLPHEVASFIEAVTAEPSGEIRDWVLVSLYTGARKANVLAMRWDEIDFKARTWRIPLTKNGTAQTIPLEDAELEILTRRKVEAATGCHWVFPGTGATGHLADPKAGWARILERAGIQDLRIHDLRRSLASFMVDSGASMAVIGKALNHQSQVTTAIYARLSLDPVREAKRAAHAAILGAWASEGGAE